MLAASAHLGPYEIVAPLGAGGMGEVYRARDTRLGREVAIKVLPEPFATSPDRQARFEREARAVAALSHPNILAIHDYGTHAGVTYAVMELLEGETLRSRLARGPIPWREAVEVGAAVADGLAAAHAKGIIHRDLKPENLFLTTDGRVKILDFGLARMDAPPDCQAETGPYVPAATSPGVVMGTAGYMSPEQVRGQPTDARSDIFSFGCVLYEMVTGRRAFQRDTGAETMTAILHDEPTDPTASGQPVPAELGRIIRQCLAKNPNQRLQSARDLALGLRATASDAAVHRVPAARRFSWRLAGVTAAVLLIGAIALSMYLLSRGSNHSGAGKPPEDAKAVEAVAVLPFKNVGGKPETEYLSDGVADQIINSLSQVRRKNLIVRPFTSVSRYKGKELNEQTIGRELNVQMLVTGTLRQQGDDLAIHVALVDVQDDNNLWSNTYEGKRDKILDLQDRIAREVATKLRLHLTGDEEKRLTKRYTEDPDAYLLYRLATYHFDKVNPSSLETSINYCKQALRRDSNYALAYMKLGAGYLVLGAIFRGWGDNYDQAKKNLKQAVAIDNSLGQAHSGLGMLYMYHDWDWKSAKRELELGKELDPMDPACLGLYGYYLGSMNRPEEALPFYQQAQLLNPLNPQEWKALAVCHNWLREHEKAIDEARRALELDPYVPTAHQELATAYVHNNMCDEAIADLLQALARGPQPPLVKGMLGYAYAMDGKRAEAKKVLEDLEKLAPGRFGYAFPITRVYAALGEKDLAFKWLRKACEERYAGVIWLKVDPTMDSLRSDPRFDGLLQRMGLADKTAAPDQAIQSVAVLPFVNKDPKTEFLSDGIADQIINSLSEIRRKDLKVRPFGYVERYKGKNPEIRACGRELNVQIIVSGKLRQDGDKLAISVSVDDVEQGSRIWGHEYDPKPRDQLQDLRDRIVHDVVARLRLQLTGEEDKQLTKHYTKDNEAYLLYLEGKHEHGKFTEEGILNAKKLFERAIEKDSKYAPAWVGKGDCYILLGAFYKGPKETFAQAKECYERARDIDPAAPGLMRWRAPILMFLDWDWPAAKTVVTTEYLELDPFLAFYWASQGQTDKALTAMKDYGDVGALPPAQWNELAKAYNWDRKPDDAIKCAKEALKADPNFPPAFAELVVAYMQKNKPEEAIDALLKAPAPVHALPHFKGMLGYAYAKAGKEEKARSLLQDLREQAKGRYGCKLSIAYIHAALGETREAFEWIDQACEERDWQVIFIKVDLLLKDLRKDPRYAKVLEKMHLPP